jgi:hypothetical protein
MKKTIKPEIVIHTDGKYCFKHCCYIDLSGDDFFCNLFRRILFDNKSHNKLLRCKKCLKETGGDK